LGGGGGSSELEIWSAEEGEDPVNPHDAGFEEPPGWTGVPLFELEDFVFLGLGDDEICADLGCSVPVDRLPLVEPEESGKASTGGGDSWPAVTCGSATEDCFDWRYLRSPK
jgi:hypothetical protein